MRKAGEIEIITNEIDYIIKNEISTDNEIEDMSEKIKSAIHNNDLVFNLNKNSCIDSADDINDTYLPTKDNNLLSFICICDKNEWFCEKIKQIIEKVKSYNKPRTFIDFYVLVFSFEDKIKINDLKGSWSGKQKVKINFYPFFLSLIHKPEYLIKVNENISNCISITGKTNRDKKIRSELYSVDLFDLIDLYNDYGDDLFKDNVRFHLNNIKYKSIDENIRKTLENDPEMFWFYHNGITMLLKNENIDRDRIETITIKSTNVFSIINGAQTLYTVSEYYFLLQKEEEKNKELINKIKKAKVLLRIIINDTEDSQINRNITIYLNSQKAVGVDDIRFFDERIQAINGEIPGRKEIVRNGDLEDKYSISLINFLKFYTITFLQKPGLARSNKGKLLIDDNLWETLSLEKKENATEWCINVFDTAIDFREKYESLKNLEKEHKNEKKYEYLKYEKEFCLAYYFWQTSEYSNNKQKVDFTKDFNSFVKDFISILSKYEIKGESEYDSNYFKIDSNYILLRDKLDKYNTVKEEQNHITSDK